MTILYHGTTKENYELIKSNNTLNSPVYLTPNRETAEDYAGNNSSDFVIIEVELDIEDLTYDSEFVSEPCVSESLNAGSVVSETDILITGCDVYEFEDYMLIED
jgi:hypothetical protein